MSKAIKRIPAAGWLGVLLLAFSVGCVIWVMHVHAASDASPAGQSSGERKVAGGLGYVDVEPGVAKLYTLQPGRVVKVLARDNDVVEEGAVLIQLDDTKAKEDLVQARAALKAAENDREKARFLAKKRDAQIAEAEATLAGKKAELEAAEQQRDKAKRIFAKGEGLGVSKEDVAVAEAAVRGRQAAVEAAEKGLAALKESNTVPFEEDSAEKQVEAKKALVAQAEWALDQCAIRAPKKGTVLRVSAAEGDVLGPNPREAAVMFCPAGPRIIRVEVEQEFAGRLFLNQTAEIRDDSSNSPLWRGKVTRLSDWFSHRRSMIQEPMQFNDVRTLECIVTLDANEKTPLRVGQRVRVTFEAGN
jgi:multidrug resistance efflux pump